MSEDDMLVITRLSLHALAARVISPLRVQATGNEIALQVRPGGFGTPELPGGSWVGVRGTDLVVVEPDGEERCAAITSLRAAAEMVGLDDAAALPDEPLELHAGAASILAEAWATGDEALQMLAEHTARDDDASPIHLWPEHFDIAVERGPEGARATFGVSPGDEGHDEPYAYVSAWSPPPAGDLFWNASGFPGAERPADDPEEIAAFWRDAAARLRAGGGA